MNGFDRREQKNLLLRPFCSSGSSVQSVDFERTFGAANHIFATVTTFSENNYGLGGELGLDDAILRHGSVY